MCHTQEFSDHGTLAALKEYEIDHIDRIFENNAPIKSNFQIYHELTGIDSPSTDDFGGKSVKCTINVQYIMYCLPVWDSRLFASPQQLPPYRGLDAERF